MQDWAQTVKHITGTFAHQAILLAPKLLLYLTRTYLLSHSFVFAYVSSDFLKDSRGIGFDKQNRSEK